MKISIVVGGGHQKKFGELLAEGFRRHGETVDIGLTPGRDPDLVVTWGVRKTIAIDCARDFGVRLLVMERAYLGDRFNWLSLGYDGLNGTADFDNARVSADRWDRYWSNGMQPWSSPGSGHALIIGQVPGDKSLGGVDPYRWAALMAGRAGAIYDRVIFRPHPQAVRRSRHIPPVGCEVSRDRTLADDMSGAALVITYSSNAAVDAVYAGVPAVAQGPASMALAVTTRAPEEAPIRPDRTDWGARLAYCQWTPDEVSTGEAWAHLKLVARREFRRSAC